MNWHHQHVIITGGSSGIGRATARLLTRRGAHVSIIARRQELLDETLAELKGMRKDPTQVLQAYSADLTSWEQAPTAVAALTAGGRSPDVLINAAGFVHPGYFEELPLDVFHTTMDADYFSTLYTTRATVPMMKAQQSGHIVNFSSGAGFLGVFGYTAYSAAKFAVRGFSDALRAELKPYGIYVSVIFPPDTDTPQLHYENQFKPPETRRIGAQARTMTADQVALELVRGIERRRTYILPGFETWASFQLCNGLTPLFLRYFDWIIAQVRRERRKQR